MLLGRPELKTDESTARTILADMNRLMEQSRRLDDQRTQMRGGGPADVASISEERQGLATRIAETQDPEARADLEKSLALCTVREELLRAATPAVERLEAQQEIIIQTFGSIQATLSRLESAHQALAAPDVDEIQQRVGKIADDALATETAVQEVLMLRQQT